MDGDSTRLAHMLSETIRLYRETNPRQCREHSIKACGMHMVAAFMSLSKFPDGSAERVYTATVTAMADEVHKILSEVN
jgi:hypothetical protein